jgi:hypothetical protein
MNRYFTAYDFFRSNKKNKDNNFQSFSGFRLRRSPLVEASGDHLWWKPSPSEWRSPLVEAVAFGVAITGGGSLPPVHRSPTTFGNHLWWKPEAMA